MKSIVSGVIGQLVRNSLRLLLNEKHLYQSVEVDFAEAPKLVRRVKAEMKLKEAGPTISSIAPALSRPKSSSEDQISPLVSEYVNSPWIVFSGSHLYGTYSTMVPFELPSINTYCDVCASRPPFTPMSELSACGTHQPGGVQAYQWFDLSYECQQCKGAQPKGVPVRFLVRREGRRLRLCGRDPIEALPVPKDFPKAHSKFYSNALVAHHAGQTLAGIFLLRTFIEQYWRSLPEGQAVLQKQPRTTGEELGTTYQATLPDDFKNRFPSLRDVYAKLSAAMHEADANAGLFEETCRILENHFEAKRLFNIR